MNNANFIENQNNGKLPFGRNGQVRKDPMWLHNKALNPIKRAGKNDVCHRPKPYNQGGKYNNHNNWKNKNQTIEITLNKTIEITPNNNTIATKNT